MQTRYFSSHIALIVVIAFFTSCKKKFLDVPDKSFLLRQEYVKDLNTTQHFLNGIYIMLSSDFFHGYNEIYPELISDNVKPASSVLAFQYNWSQLSNDITSLQPSNSSSNMNPMWMSGYKIIRACNFVIEKSDELKSENMSMADNLKGQALAIRAFMHFNMVKVYSQPYSFSANASHPGIPYVTTSDWTQSVSRQTVSDTYTGIITDLSNAIKLMPVEVPSTLIINRPAIQSLLARAYIFTGNFEMAKLLATDIAKTFPIMTIAAGYPENVFKLNSITQTESLFQLSPSGTGYSTNFLGRYLGNGSNTFLATNDIAEILNESPDDIRRNWVKLVSGKWRIYKYPTGVIPDISTPSRVYFPTLVRSSEMYLIAAEAMAKSNNEDSARIYLDAIRLRSNPNATPTVANGAALLDSIYKERRKEFAFEGTRMFDLLRLKKSVIRQDAPPNAQNLPYPSDKSIAPIPLLDTKLSGLAQNPSY